MRDHLRRLVKGSSVYTLGALLPKTIGIILIPVYTRYLTTEEYGILALVATIHSILYITMEMGLGHAVLRFYFDWRDNPAERKRFLGTVQFFLFGANLLVLGVLVLFGRQIFAFLSFDFYPYVLLGLLTTYFALGAIVPLELFRAREQAGRYVLFQVAYFVLALSAIIWFVAGMGRGPEGALRARLYVTVGFCAVYWIAVAREIRPVLVGGILKKALYYGLPLVPMALANWVVTFSDRILLDVMVGRQAVGIYALGYAVGMVMGDLVRSINKAYAPYFFDTAAAEPKAAPVILARVALVYMVVVSTIGLFGVLFAREGVMLLATPRYYDAIPVVPFVIIGYFLRGMQYMTVNPLYYLKRTGVLAAATVLAAALNVGLNLLLIPRLGFMGAAYSTVAAYLAAFVLLFVWAQKRYPIPYDYPKIGVVLVLFACCALAGILPSWQGVVWPLTIKAAVLIGFVAGLFLLGVVRWENVRQMLVTGKGQTRE